MAFWMRKQQRVVAVQNRATRSKIARRPAPDVTDPLPGDGRPIKPFAVLF
jgi:hypothetical protein